FRIGPELLALRAAADELARFARRRHLGRLEVRVLPLVQVALHESHVRRLEVAYDVALDREDFVRRRVAHVSIAAPRRWTADDELFLAALERHRDRRLRLVESEILRLVPFDAPDVPERFERR